MKFLLGHALRSDRAESILALGLTKARMVPHLLTKYGCLRYYEWETSLSSSAEFQVCTRENKASENVLRSCTTLISIWRKTTLGNPKIPKKGGMFGIWRRWKKRRSTMYARLCATPMNYYYIPGALFMPACLVL